MISFALQKSHITIFRVKHYIHWFQIIIFHISHRYSISFNGLYNSSLSFQRLSLLSKCLVIFLSLTKCLISLNIFIFTSSHFKDLIGLQKQNKSFSDHSFFNIFFTIIGKCRISTTLLFMTIGHNDDTGTFSWGKFYLCKY